MKNLFKYILHYWQAVIAIVAILIVQAYCDLSLPAYTSDIVNVGILQGGIEDKAPTAISEEEWNKLMLFVSENDLQTVKDAYQKNEDSYDKPAFVLKEAVKENETELKEVEDALALPMMITSGFESGSEKTQEAEEMLKQQIPKEMLTEDTTVFDILQMLPSEAREELTKELQKEMKVPVGMLQIAFGGTVIESWMSREVLAAMPNKDKYMDPEAMKAEYDAG